MIEIKPYQFALQTPYRWSKGTQYHRLGLVARLQVSTAVGDYIGWGEAALPPHVDYAPDAFAQEARSLLTGLDPLASDFLEQLGLRECPARIRCALSSAVLSLRAAQAGQGLAAYLLQQAGIDRTPPSR
jgi:L-alanine-DL-glutamate epimerase-like enolase superfamily enzyme